MRMFALLIALIFFTTAHSADDLPPTLMTVSYTHLTLPTIYSV